PRNEALYRVAEMELRSASSFEEGSRHLDQALDRAPDYDRALTALSGAVRAGPHSPQLIRVYERVARAVGGDELLLDALTLRSSLPDATLELMLDATELARRLGDSERRSILLPRLVLAARREGAEDRITEALVDLAAIREAAKDYKGAAELLEEAAKQGGAEA